MKQPQKYATTLAKHFRFDSSFVDNITEKQGYIFFSRMILEIHQRHSKREHFEINILNF